MIKAYHRPSTLEEALQLLAQPDTLPLGSGLTLNSPEYRDRVFSVVDMQNLGLDHVRKHGNYLEVGATVTLNQLFDSPHTPAAVQQAIRQEAIPGQGSVAGRLVAGDGRSPLATTLLALDAVVEIQNAGQEPQKINIGAYLPLLPPGLIIQINIPLNVSITCAYDAPGQDGFPLVYVALAQWKSGRTRLALGGFGKTPTLAMDGTESDGMEPAARNAFHEATDARANASYRMDMAAALSKRCLQSLA